MQDHPGAPGTARKGTTRTVVPAACGGAAAHPMAPGHDHPLATPVRLPGQDRPCAVPPAPDHDRSRARHTRAPGHERPPVAQRAARHDRPSATPQAPGHDVPLVTVARAPGYGCPSAAPSVPVPDRSRSAQRAPGHERPSVVPLSAAGHDRPRATPQAPGHDVPLVTVARAPGHGRPSAAQLVPEHQRSQHAPMAPPGHALARAGTYVPIAIAPLPARVSRLFQARLTATPSTLIYPHAHRLHRHSRFPPRHSRASGNLRPPVATGGPPRGYAPATRPATGRCLAPSPGACSGGGLGREPLPTHQVHPAIQIPPRPRSCSTAYTGFRLHHPARAPPAAAVPLRSGGAIGGPASPRLPHRLSPPAARIASSAEGFSSEETSPGSSAR